MTLPEVLIRVIEVAIAYYLGKTVYSWFSREGLKKIVKYESPIKPTERLKGLFENEQPELKLHQKDRILTAQKGFCPKHLDETRVVIGRKVNECYSCLQDKKRK